ncbi:CBS domain protein [Halohasta litchfieldiae]|jgi:CBS domain-containing protein|uniref:CBS domain-containing protein n=1 Tax=Halohasta litchfieldiae TaxID=1073996 RepID=A0A1H6XDG1_9EURY|nr:CBS domain-containing protein [Halohasta litchfieldiae]ATW88130.1 CBS domain protein [Halohasta litchfieldiae]SEJ22930.1 CBS domain-containing protein [Halohasta litchfieldiae]
MSTDLVTVPSGATMKGAAGQMLHNDVGSVIVLNNETPAGIVTEMDALRVGYAANRPFESVPVRKVMSRPLITIEPTKTARTAIGRMHKNNIKKLPVVSGFDLVGILTMTDIVQNHGKLLNEARNLESGHGRRDPDEWRGGD